MSLKENDLSGAIPTQLGYCNQMNSCFDLGLNFLSLAIPTQLGLLGQMRDGFDLAWNSLSSAIPTQLGRLGQNFDLSSNLLSSAIPTQLGQLDQMTYYFDLSSNSLCSDLPTELASLPSVLDRQMITDGNFIGSSCLPSSSADNSNTQTSGIATTMRVLGGVGLAIAMMVLAALSGYKYATRTKSRAASDDDNESIISNTSQIPLLHDSDVLDLESNGSGVRLDIDPDADGPEHGLQLQSTQDLKPLGLVHLARDWRSSGMQLVVLDHELRVVVWSKGMTTAMPSVRPAQGTSMEALPFSSVEAQQRTVSELESIMREEGAEDEAALHPTLALQAAVTTSPNVSMHLVTPLSNGLHKELLLSMTAIKMMPFATALPSAAESQGFYYEPCHLLILGQESFDPGLASLAHDAASSTVSDLTSSDEATVNLATILSLLNTNSSTTESNGDVAEVDSGIWRTSNSLTKSSSSGDDPEAAGGTYARGRRRRDDQGRDDVTVDSRDTADILEGHHLLLTAWRVDAAAGSTVDSRATSEIMGTHRRGRRLWRSVRPKLLVVARFRWMLTRARRLAKLRSVLERAAGELIIDEFVGREIAAHLGLFPLMPPSMPPQEPSCHPTLIDLDLQPVVENERRGRASRLRDPWT